VWSAAPGQWEIESYQNSEKVRQQKLRGEF